MSLICEMQRRNNKSQVKNVDFGDYLIAIMIIACVFIDMQVKNCFVEKNCLSMEIKFMYWYNLVLN